jgi:Fe-S cluster assembly protein SufD
MRTASEAGPPGLRSGDVDSETDAHVREFERVSDALPGSGSGWVRAERQRALSRLRELGFPSPRDEAWKYTRVTPLLRRHYRVVATEGAEVGVGDLASSLLEGLDCHRLVFVNGRHVPGLSRPGRLPEGVVLGSLAQILEDSPDLVRPWLESSPSSFGSAPDALNGAFASGGAWVYLARGARVERPLHVLHVSTESGESSASYVRNLVVAGPGSEAKLIESYVSVGQASVLTNVRTTVLVDEGANLEYYRLQEEARTGSHIARLEMIVGRDGRLTCHAVSLGSQLARYDVHALLDAEGAECTLNGLYMVDGRQHVDFHTNVEHARPRGTSREYFKGVLGGRARGVFNGRVHVHPGAQKTDSEQSNKNLLLSRDAEVDTKPELEIYADDVKCSHGATVGQLDPEMLFYLRARGIDEGLARGMLTFGFAQDIVERMSLQAVRSHLEELLVGRVPGAERVGSLS